MKPLLVIFLLISFIGIAVFGFTAMKEAMDSHAKCLASTASGVDCPSADLFDFIAFHLSAFKSFVLAIFQSPLLASILLAVLFLVIILSYSRDINLVLTTFFQKQFNNFLRLQPFLAQQKIAKWFILKREQDARHIC